ncbi:hypothetical protein BKA69DRAFT_1063502 [Paraphysoderma sedebokerense]|nr:hypothetical protein BKA69DRAFT_1063502 [Paraphysoderma sedebokerense]
MEKLLYVCLLALYLLELVMSEPQLLPPVAVEKLPIQSNKPSSTCKLNPSFARSPICQSDAFEILKISSQTWQPNGFVSLQIRLRSYDEIRELAAFHDSDMFNVGFMGNQYKMPVEISLLKVDVVDSSSQSTVRKEQYRFVGTIVRNLDLRYLEDYRVTFIPPLWLDDGLYVLSITVTPSSEDVFLAGQIPIQVPIDFQRKSAELVQSQSDRRSDIHILTGEIFDTILNNLPTITDVCSYCRIDKAASSQCDHVFRDSSFRNEFIKFFMPKESNNEATALWKIKGIKKVYLKFLYRRTHDLGVVIERNFLSDLGLDKHIQLSRSEEPTEVTLKTEYIREWIQQLYATVNSEMFKDAVIETEDGKARRRDEALGLNVPQVSILSVFGTAVMCAGKIACQLLF